MKKEENYKALIFDIGGVIFLPKDKKKREFKNLLSSYKELCFLLKGISMLGEEFWEKSKDIYLKSTKGEITKKQQLVFLSKILDLSQEKVESLFTKTIRSNIIENKPLYNLITKLKKKCYKLGILSIQQHLSKESLIPKKYKEIFDSMVISCDDNVRKPDLKSFELILKRLKVRPEEALFVDDKQENLDAAKKLEINTLIFKNNKQFFSELKERGIK